ncbi:uncharacterized protein LOC106169694 [Lingula anatina]|uniref:Uncharacterized protein LOC106169694 n=1 Tax=Lingula anatina TaxID=7574 RepID=A0A1S3J3A3_LINAN|nr:uncharacterized protein LOC106169694 [Lingula anatina]|eukprot:XP_013404733.1 uncharacterized protein LOC106169694 [Lingula anatina]
MSKYCCPDSHDRYIYSYSASYQCSTPTRGEFCCAYYTSSGKYKSAFYCEKYCCGSSTSKYCCLTSRYRYLYSYSYNSSCPAPIKALVPLLLITGEYCCAYYNSYGTYRSSFFCTKYCCGTPTSKYCCTSSYSRYSPSYSSASLCIPPKSMDEEHEGEWGDISMVFILAPFMFISGVVFIVIRKVCRRTPPGVIHGHQRQPTHSMQTRQTMVSSTPTTSYGPGVHPPTSGAPPSNFGYSPGAPPPTTGYSPGAPPPTTGYSPGAPPPTTGYSFIPGLCDAHNLEIGKSYYVLAYSGLRPTRVQEVTLDNSAMNELTSVCNLQMTYPLGVDAASPPVKCTAPADQSSCVQPSPDRGWGEESSEAPPEDSTTEDSAMPNLQEGTTLGSNAVDGGSGSASTWHFDSINICLSVLFVLLWN